MRLAALQREFLSRVLEDRRPLPSAWGPRMAAGLEVYRNAYRARLIEALRETFPCTAKWAGEEPFRAAAAHYLISEPPTGWTLDQVGDGFPRTLDALFAKDPDVADLAWLEWAMHRAFTAADATALGPGEFVQATSGFDESKWAAMRLLFVPALDIRRVRTDCTALWRSLRSDDAAPAEQMLDAATSCIVWREGHSPVFRLIDGLEGECLELMMRGSTFGEICAGLGKLHSEAAAAQAAGRMLHNWLSLGLIASVKSDSGAKTRKA